MHLLYLVGFGRKGGCIIGGSRGRLARWWGGRAGTDEDGSGNGDERVLVLW